MTTPAIHNRQREAVLQAAREGRATFLPAYARDNTVAMVLIDGAPFGSASVVEHYVTPADTGRTFGEVPLVPLPDYQLPEHLRARD